MNRIVKVLLCSALLLNSTISHAMDHDAAAINNDAECIICKTTPQDATISNEAVFTCEPGHKFICCDSCMAGWIQTKGQNATCPYCRAPLREHFDEIPPLTQAVLEEVQAAQEVAHIPAPAEHEHIIPILNEDTLISAAHRGDIEQVLAFLHQGINVNAQNEDGVTALRLAAGAGHLAVVQALLASPDINVNAQSPSGLTALILATENGHLEVVQTLLEHHNANDIHDIDVNIGDDRDTTALMYAAQKGHLEIAQVLLAFPEININATNGYNHTALMKAAKHGHLAIVQALLALPGINANVMDVGGYTALIRATEFEHIEVVQALLMYHDALGNTGIDINLRNTSGRTALSWAPHDGQIRQLLIAHGAHE